MFLYDLRHAIRRLVREPRFTIAAVLTLALGTGAGLAIGLVAARSLRSILYGVSSADPLILVAATAVLVGTTMAACYLPARRASRVDPARTLAEQ